MRSFLCFYYGTHLIEISLNLLEGKNMTEDNPLVFTPDQNEIIRDGLEISLTQEDLSRFEDITILLKYEGSTCDSSRIMKADGCTETSQTYNSDGSISMLIPQMGEKLSINRTPQNGAIIVDSDNSEPIFNSHVPQELIASLLIVTDPVTYKSGGLATFAFRQVYQVWQLRQSILAYYKSKGEDIPIHIPAGIFLRQKIRCKGSDVFTIHRTKKEAAP